MQRLYIDKHDIYSVCRVLLINCRYSLVSVAFYPWSQHCVKWTRLLWWTLVTAILV